MRVAVLSDIHSNIVALEAVLAAAGDVDAVWHLGDNVGYGPDPNLAITRLEAAGATGVRGNHDAAAAGGPEIEWFNPDARRAMEWTRDAIDGASRAWLTAHVRARRGHRHAAVGRPRCRAGHRVPDQQLGRRSGCLAGCYSRRLRLTGSLGEIWNRPAAIST